MDADRYPWGVVPMLEDAGVSVPAREYLRHVVFDSRHGNLVGVLGPTGDDGRREDRETILTRLPGIGPRALPPVRIVFPYEISKAEDRQLNEARPQRGDALRNAMHGRITRHHEIVDLFAPGDGAVIAVEVDDTLFGDKYRGQVETEPYVTRRGGDKLAVLTHFVLPVSDERHSYSLAQLSADRVGVLRAARKEPAALWILSTSTLTLEQHVLLPSYHPGMIDASLIGTLGGDLCLRVIEARTGRFTVARVNIIGERILIEEDNTILPNESLVVSENHLRLRIATYTGGHDVLPLRRTIPCGLGAAIAITAYSTSTPANSIGLVVSHMEAEGSATVLGYWCPPGSGRVPSGEQRVWLGGMSWREPGLLMACWYVPHTGESHMAHLWVTPVSWRAMTAYPSLIPREIFHAARTLAWLRCRDEHALAHNEAPESPSPLITMLGSLPAELFELVLAAAWDGFMHSVWLIQAPIVRGAALQVRTRVKAPQPIAAAPPPPSPSLGLPPPPAKRAPALAPAPAPAPVPVMRPAPRNIRFGDDW